MDKDIDWIEPKYYTRPAHEVFEGGGVTSLAYWAKVMYKKEMDPEIKQIYKTMLITRYEEDYQNTNYYDFGVYFDNMVRKLIKRYNAG